MKRVMLILTCGALPLAGLGWIEVGESDMISAFVRAYSEGGTIYEGKDSYPSMAEAFKDKIIA